MSGVGEEYLRGFQLSMGASAEEFDTESAVTEQLLMGNHAVCSVPTMLANYQSHIHTTEFPMFICFLNQGSFHLFFASFFRFPLIPWLFRLIFAVTIYIVAAPEVERVFRSLNAFEFEA
jgi:hypothetical protein